MPAKVSRERAPRTFQGHRSRPRRQSHKASRPDLCLGLIFVGELHAWGRRACPGECGWGRPVTRFTQVDLAIGEIGLVEADLAAGELGVVKVDHATREPRLVEHDLSAGELSAVEANCGARELGV